MLEHGHLYGTTVLNNTPFDADLIEQERNILTRVAQGGPLDDVLRDLILLVEKPSEGEMRASILFISPDGGRLLQGAAPSLPVEYNSAIHGIAIGDGVGSCGTAAYNGEAVFVEDIASDPLWKDFKDLAVAHDLRACWSVPIKGSDGKVLGTFANYYREPKRPSQHDMAVIDMVAQTAGIAIERHRRDVERARFDEQRDLLMRELNHRVKNVFALANSLLVMTARAATDPQQLVRAVQGRLKALSKAHELVQPGLKDGATAQFAAVALRDVIADILEPYAISSDPKRVHIDGPDLRISADAVTPIALIVHELATNAAKYGALSVSNGTVDVTWSIAGTLLTIDWTEDGGPRPVKPNKSGFGTTLTQRSVEGQLGGEINYDWRNLGLAVAIALPLAAITGRAL